MRRALRRASHARACRRLTNDATPADGLTLDSHFDGLLARHHVRPYAKFITPDNAHLATPDALDFIDKRACAPARAKP